MPRDAVSRTANAERNGGHKWVKVCRLSISGSRMVLQEILIPGIFFLFKIQVFFCVFDEFCSNNLYKSSKILFIYES